MFRKLFMLTCFTSVLAMVTSDAVFASVWEGRISSALDDLEEIVSSGNYDNTSSDLEITEEGDPGSNQLIGLRFNDVLVPQGANITNAYVQFHVDETDVPGDNRPGTKFLRGEAADNADPFSTASPYNISSRPTTSAEASWDWPIWTTEHQEGPDQRTSDISAVIKEITDRPGWSAGNSLVLIITGTGENTAESFDGEPAGAALLHIEFSTKFASSPSPADGAQHEDTWASLGWEAGETAVTHDVYMSDNFDEVNDRAPAAFLGNQGIAFMTVGFQSMPYPDGLVPGTTYYWAIDEVETDGTTKHRGRIWSFWIPPTSAYAPDPSDGRQYVDTDVTLNWTAGFGAKLHTVHFGDDLDTVSNATGGVPQATTTFIPGSLELDRTYYWRVDELNPPTTVKGDVWSFTTLPDIPITDPHLVGWWKFAAGGGTKVIDFSGHGNHGDIVGNVLWAPGQFNLALEFLGDDQGHVELPPGMVTTASGSVAMWVQTDLTSDEGMFWYGTESSGDGFGDELEIHIHIDDPGVLGFHIEGPVDVSLGGPPLAGTGWNHVAATWDQTDGCMLYLNGAQVDFQGHNNTVADLATIRLGRPVGTGNGNRYHDGLMDDVRLFDHAITADQINEIISKGENSRQAGAPNPRNGSAVGIDEVTSLNWSAGDAAASHDVYFGTDRDAVAGADNSAPEFQGNQAGASLPLAGLVEFGGGDYYWRINEVAADGTVTAGTIWKFTVPDYLVVDDFESYNDINEGEPGSNRIYLTWIDGFGTTTNGSQAGNLDPPFMSAGHSGAQAMPVSYDNAGKTSEVTRTLADKKDWTRHGVTKLVVWFRGDSANAPERMFVALNGTAVVYHDDPAATQVTEWNEWVIDLAAFGIDLTNVNTITIGFGTKNSPVAGGGTGTVHFDDIRLVP